MNWAPETRASLLIRVRDPADQAACAGPAIFAMCLENRKPLARGVLS